MPRSNTDQYQTTDAALSGTYPAPKEPQANGTVPKNSSRKDISKIAQEVRSLPPLQQRRMVVGAVQDPWSKKVQEEQKEHERALELQRLRKQQMKAEQKQFLDAQVARREEQRQLEKERLKMLAAEEAHQRALWKEEAEYSARRRKEDTDHMRQDLVHQRQSALLRKQQELAEKKRDDEEKVQRLQQEIREEEQERLHKREKVPLPLSSPVTSGDSLGQQRAPIKGRCGQAAQASPGRCLSVTRSATSVCFLVRFTNTGFKAMSIGLMAADDPDQTTFCRSIPFFFAKKVRGTLGCLGN